MIYKNYIEPILTCNKLKGYDIVQMVNPSVYPRRINNIMVKILKRYSGKLFISIAGDCYPVYRSYKDGLLGYYIYDNNEKLCKKYDSNGDSFCSYQYIETFALDKADGIIPIMYEYAVGVRNRNNTLKTIPIPFDCEGIEYKPNLVKNGKIVIFHGIIREEAKGSSYIKRALEIIQQRHPDDVEVIIDGKMPLDKYLTMLYDVNILVDQCKEHCYGMNALYAMAEGRIVLGGASENSLRELEVDVEKCPVVHIEPDVEQIVNKLETVISQRANFEKLGYDSRKYVEEIHDCKKIAQRYVDTWNRCAGKTEDIK